jgi:hypothetical protein
MKKIVLFTSFLFLMLTFSSCNPNDGYSGLGHTDDYVFAQNFGNTVARDFIGQVVDVNNVPLQNVTIKIGTTTAQTDVNGVFIINAASVHTRFAYITATKAGYIDGSRSLAPTAGKNNVRIMLLPNTPTETIQSGVASEVTLSSGTKVSFDGAFQDENGVAYTGDVSVAMFHLLPSNENIDKLMPGMLYAQTADNKEAVLQTFGMLNIELRGSAGQKLNIAKEHTAEITIRIDDNQLATAPSTIPLWHFDEEKGYWKEDGIATKEGNYYVGTVSHFSWWNCDAQFPTVSLTTTVVDVDGNPMSDVRVGLLPTGFPYTAYGTTNSIGTVSGLVPSNQTMTLTVLDLCSNIIYTSSIGPFTTNTVLPNIVITSVMAQSTVVQGTLLKCDNTNVTNGYVLMKSGTQNSLVAVSNGAFSFNTLVCATNSNFTLEGFDYENLQTSGTINYTYTTPTTSVGILTTCNTVSEFISYQIDSGSPVMILTNINAATVISGTGFTISGGLNSPVGGASIYISGSTNIPGLYTTAEFSIEGTLGLIDSGITNTVQFNLSNFGNIGEYIDLTFNGTYEDGQVAGITHTISGTVHVLRDN